MFTTRPSLPGRLAETPPNEPAWAEFVRHYRPFIRGKVYQFGVSTAAGADEIVDGVCAAVAIAVRRFEYRGQPGGFRNWLFRITRTELLTWLRFHRPPGRADFDPADLADESSAASRVFEQEHADHLAQVFAEAAGAVAGPDAVRAFRLYKLEGRPIEEVESLVGRDRQWVFVNCSRIAAGLRRFFPEYAGDNSAVS